MGAHDDLSSAVLVVRLWREDVSGRLRGRVQLSLTDGERRTATVASAAEVCALVEEVVDHLLGAQERPDRA